MKTTTKVSEQTSEPSMEDILSSIRKIISGDEEISPQAAVPVSGGQPHGGVSPEPVQEPEVAEIFEDDQEILDLIHLLRDDNTVEVVEPYRESIATVQEAPQELMAAKPKKQDPAPAEEVKEEASAEAEAKEEGKEETPKVGVPKEGVIQEEESALEEKAPATEASKTAEDLVSEATISEAAAALDTLTKLTDKDQPKESIDEVGEKTVDALMKDVLRPLLREWLDANLPSLVRTIVTEQVQKIVQQQHKAHDE